MTAAAVTTSLSKPSRFASATLVNRLTPVAFPPGRLRVATKPSLTGSPPIVKTIGMVDVAALAASAEGSPPVARAPPNHAERDRLPTPVADYIHLWPSGIQSPTFCPPT